jgi:hypothetical protein
LTQVKYFEILDPNQHKQRDADGRSMQLRIKIPNANLDTISSDMLANPPSLILLPSGLKMAEKGPWPEKVGNILSKD